MADEPRVTKTLHRKLSDLDDHLRMTEDLLARVAGGDEAYRKLLATELRLLLCGWPRKKRGLWFLWHVADELGISDAVGKARSHFTGKTAGVVEGIAYSDEELIFNTASQIGSAHEDPEADRGLAIMDRARGGHLSILSRVIVEDAKLALQVGDQVLAHAEKTCGFQRQWRPAPPGAQTGARHVGSRPEGQEPHFVDTLSLARDEGTIEFWLHCGEAEWQMDSFTYDFGEVSDSGISVAVHKSPQRIVCIALSGVCDGLVSVNAPLAKSAGDKAMIAVTWTENALCFYVNGQLVWETPRLEPMSLPGAASDSACIDPSPVFRTGAVKDIRFATVARSSAWIASVYSLTSSPGAAWTIGDVQPV